MDDLLVIAFVVSGPSGMFKCQLYVLYNTPVVFGLLGRRLFTFCQELACTLVTTDCFNGFRSCLYITLVGGLVLIGPSIYCS